MVTSSVGTRVETPYGAGVIERVRSAREVVVYVPGVGRLSLVLRGAV